MSARIREIKEALALQNNMIAKLKTDNESNRTAMIKMYTALVRLKPTYQSGVTVVEDAQYPDLKGEDLAKMGTDALTDRAFVAVSALVSSLMSVRQEVTSLYKELDEDVEAEMAKWATLRDQSDNQAKAQAFRDHSVTSLTKERSKTPDMVASSAGRHGPSLPETPPEAPGTRKPVPAVEVGKPKANAITLAEAMSPTSAKRPDAAPTSDKTKAHSSKK